VFEFVQLGSEVVAVNPSLPMRFAFRFPFFFSNFNAAMKFVGGCNVMDILF
jgi:hypothetical protein